MNQPSRKAIKKKSARQIVIDKCLDLIRAEMRAELGNKCQICGRTAPNLGLFHILPRKYSRLILHRENLLLVCWYPCHHAWHTHRTDSPQGKRVQEGIIRLRGKDYETRLKVLAKLQPKMTLTHLNMYLKALERGKR